MWSRASSVHRGALQGVSGAALENPLLETAAFPDTTPIPSSSTRSDVPLVNAVLAGDPAAAERFIDGASATLWSAVTKLEGGGAEGEAAFLHVVASLKADGYARLRAFDGRARLATYLERDVIRAWCEAHWRGEQNLGLTLWNLLTLEVWLRLCAEGHWRRAESGEAVQPMPAVVP